MACEYNDLLTVTGFTMVIDGYPKFRAAIQGFTHPTVSIGFSPQMSPKRDIPRPGEKFQYDPVNVTMLINTDMSVYKTVLDWLEDCVNSAGNVEKDVTLNVMSGSNTVVAKIVYADAFPIDIGAISFTTTDTNDSWVSVDVTMAYSSYSVVPI